MCVYVPFLYIERQLLTIILWFMEPYCDFTANIMEKWIFLNVDNLIVVFSLDLSKLIKLYYISVYACLCHICCTLHANKVLHVSQERGSWFDLFLFYAVVLQEQGCESYCSCAHKIVRLVLWFLVQHVVVLPLVIPLSLAKRPTCFGDSMSPYLWIPYLFSMDNSEDKLSEVLAREWDTSHWISMRSISSKTQFFWIQ